MSAHRRDVVLSSRQLVRALTEQQPTADGCGVTAVRVGTERFSYEVSIDMRQIDAMAFRAAKNKDGIAQRGALQVKVYERCKI